MKWRWSISKNRILQIQTLILATSVLIFIAASAGAEDLTDPMGSSWQNPIVSKHRGIVSFMADDWSLKTYRGQGTAIDPNLAGFYGTNLMQTSPGELQLSGGASSRVFSMSQAAGSIPTTVTLETPFMDRDSFDNVPTGVLCSAYLTMSDSDGKTTGVWMELTDENGRIGRVKLNGAPAPVYKYKFNADGSHKYAPALDMNVAQDTVAWDWNGDGYTDYVLTYIHNPSGNNNWQKKMKVATVFVDGRSLYEACDGNETVSFWSDTSSTYSTGGDIVGGLTNVKPANSCRTAIGDMDADGNPEVALYYTKVCGPSGLAHNNSLRLLSLTYDGTTPAFNWIQTRDSDVGKWYVQYDSVGAAMGDLDGDGTDELAVMHGNTPALHQNSRLYLDVYKLVNGELKKFVTGEIVGYGPKMAANSAPAIEMATGDLDGDGTDELVWCAPDQGNSEKLWLVVHKWPHGSGGATLTGIGDKHAVDLYSLTGSWLLNKSFIHFSMDTGRFIYPERESLEKQIGIVCMGNGSSGKANLDWGFFTWDKDSSFQILGKGTQSDGAMASNLVPSIVATDLNQESMVLGDPSGFTVYDNVDPLFVVQAPPRHWDEVISSDGESLLLDAFSGLKGYSTTVDRKTSTSHGESTTEASSGHFGASVEYTLSKKRLIRTPIPLFKAGIEYGYDEVNENTSGNTTTITTDLQAMAQYDDQLYYRVNTLEVWRYPVLYPESEATVTDGDETYRNFVQFVVPKVVQSTFSPTAGREVDWYNPYHNSLNLFSYPRKLEDTQDFPRGADSKEEDDFWKDQNGVILARSTGQTMGNVDSTTFGFTANITEHEEALHSIRHTISPHLGGFPGWGVVFGHSLAINAGGDACFGTDSVTTSDQSNLQGISVAWPGAANYASPSGLTPSEQQFTADAAIYTGDSGSVAVAYAVTRLKKAYSRIWGSSSPYSMTADPALNLPRQWVMNSGNWQKNPFPGDASRLRGLRFSGGTEIDVNGINGHIIPIDTEVTTQLRIYNYSFVRTDPVTVTLSFQPITRSDIAGSGSEPDISKATEFAQTTISGIPGRDQGLSDNWEDIELSWNTPGKTCLGYLHVSLSTTGGNLKEANDHGQILVGAYDPALLESFLSKAGSGASGLRQASESTSLGIVPGSFMIRPLLPDGSLGETTTDLDPGQAAVIEARILFNDITHVDSEKPASLVDVNVYLHDEEGIIAHRIIPLLINGREHVVRMIYTAPETSRYVPLELSVNSCFLTQNELSSQQTQMELLTIGTPDGSGGCSIGLAPQAALLALPLMLLLLKKH